MWAFRAKPVRYRGDVLLLHSIRDGGTSEFWWDARVRANETGSNAEPDEGKSGQTITDNASTTRGEGHSLDHMGQFRGGSARGAFSSDKVNGIDGSGRTVSTRNQDQDEVNEYLYCSPMPVSHGPKIISRSLAILDRESDKGMRRQHQS